MRPEPGQLAVAAVIVGAVIVGTAGCIDARSYRDAVDAGDLDAAADGPPLANHDEDRDGVDDARDNCPDTYNPGQEDTIEVEVGLAPDQVGDACDPEKDRNAIALFESFARPLADRWQVEGATPWVVAGDQAVLERADLALSSLVSAAVLDGPVLVVAKVEVLGATAGVTVELSAQWDPDTRSGPACEVVASVNGGPSRLRLIDVGAGQTTRPFPPVAAPPFAAEGAYATSATAPASGNRTCSIRDAVASGLAPPRHPGRIRLGAAGTILAVSSIVVYRLP